MIERRVLCSSNTGNTEISGTSNKYWQGLRFEILTSGYITWNCGEAGTSYDIYYSKNYGNWTKFLYNNQITVSQGDILDFQGNNQSYGGSSTNEYNYFGGTAKFNVKGNIMSMVGDTDFTSTTLTSSYNFKQLFLNCKIVSAKDLILPATTLVNYCYSQMFKGCDELIESPIILPATTLTTNCYWGMFQNCTSLISTPVLPATTLATTCYGSMFYGCTSLTTTPSLPATTLVKSCYYQMFQGCTSLVIVSGLPATTLAESCYGYMFQGCTSLVSAPALNARTLANSCYYCMFKNCSNLSYIYCMATNISASNCTYQWVSGVRSTASDDMNVLTFIKANSMTSWTTGINGIPSGWTSRDAWLGIRVYDTVTIKFIHNSNQLQYSSDNGATWSLVSNDTYINFRGGNAQGGLYLFKAYGTITPDSTNGIGRFSIIGAIGHGQATLEGNLGSLLTDNINNIETNTYTQTNYCFYKLFYASEIKYVDRLYIPPINGIHSYESMFEATSTEDGIRIPPIINTFGIVGEYQFGCMFKNNKFLQYAPILPATTLSQMCYQHIFNGCTSLTIVPNILSALTLSSNCYRYMFYGCTSLTTMTVLPATTLADSCYYYMFYNCTSLTNAPKLPATTLADDCYYSMFMKCQALIESPELPATTLTPGCYYDMFDSCTGLIKAPVLPALTLVTYCYYKMFYGCTSLNFVWCLATNISASNCTTNWVYNVASSGDFIKNANMGASTWGTGVNGIPSGWTVTSDLGIIETD